MAKQLREKRVQVIRVTEWRNGEAYTTRQIDAVWIDASITDERALKTLAKQHGGDFFLPMPSYLPESEKFRTIRI